MKDLIDTLSPENYTLSAIIAGLLLCQDFSYDQQEILGGWLMLVGQLIETNAGFGSLKNTANEKASELIRRQNEKQPQSQH